MTNLQREHGVLQQPQQSSAGSNAVEKQGILTLQFGHQLCQGHPGLELGNPFPRSVVANARTLKIMATVMVG